MESARGLGIRIGTIRKRRGLTQAELAARISRTVVSVSGIERGIHPPSFDMLQRLAEALGVPVRDFLAPEGIGEDAGPEQAALFSELLDAARNLPPADLLMAVQIVGVILSFAAKRHGIAPPAAEPVREEQHG